MSDNDNKSTFLQFRVNVAEYETLSRIAVFTIRCRKNQKQFRLQSGSGLHSGVPLRSLTQANQWLQMERERDKTLELNKMQTQSMAV
ncbi:MAG: hypothetical protein WAM14_17185 [Candidatus Nitrosopolaris sp.]